MPRIRVTQVGTGRTIVGSPDELLEWLGRWWPDEPEDGAIASHITQVVYEWEAGQFDGWRNELLGLRATALR
ncbi:MAG TPA: hypothetical protein VF143_12525 [Candidatus Nanopelagicales bacterium]